MWWEPRKGRYKVQTDRTGLTGKTFLQSVIVNTKLREEEKRTASEEQNVAKGTAGTKAYKPGGSGRGKALKEI